MPPKLSRKAPEPPTAFDQWWDGWLEENHYYELNNIKNVARAAWDARAGWGW